MGQTSSSEKETSLQNDLRQLINDERFYDITLECSDKERIFGCKGILATRSEIFNELIFTGLEKKILSFNNINSNSMKVILEYLYVSEVKKENLTVNNIIEVYHASIHFGLIEFQSHIINQVMEILKSENEDTGKKLLSECVNKFSSEEVDNEMSRILVDWVAMNKLKKGVDDSLSLEGLKYFLMKTLDTQKPFATPEIEIWEYTLTKAKKEAYDQQGVQKYLNPLAGYINLNRMDAEEIKQRIEPFNIYSDKKLKEVYFSMAVDKGLGFIRGVPIFKWKNGSGFGLKVFDGGFTVEAYKFIKQPKSILGDLIFKGRGVYEWNILVEKLCKTIYIGICDNNNVNFKKNDQDYHGWVLGSDGYVYHEKNYKWYDAIFNEGDKVTVRLDMKNRTCAFSVNDIRKLIVPEWKNIPSQVCPIASLGHGSKLRVKQELIKFC